MLASLVIVFREVFEAGLIVGIVLAATQGIAGRAAWLAGGIGAGVLGATLLALFAGALEGAFAGNGQEVFNAAILIAAVATLGWHQVWMASHGRQMAGEMKALGRDMALGRKSLFAMALVVGVAGLREGAEVVLFLYGIAASGHEGWAALMLGGALGVVLGAAVSSLLYRSLVAIPVARLFAVTGWLIALLAAGMAGQAAAILAGADLIPSWGYQLWDTSWLLPETSIPGRALHALVGYADRPMGVQLAAWLAVLAALVLGARWARGTPPGPQPWYINERPSSSATRPPMNRITASVVAAAAIFAPRAAVAHEYFVGGPVHQHDMEIVANYLVGVEMAPMLPGMAMGPDVIHVEADVHATADNACGYPDGAWVGYLGKASRRDAARAFGAT